MLATSNPAPDRTKRNLNRSLGDAACFGGMVGFGETYFAAFALAVGIGEASAGIIASVPVMIGGVAQLIMLRVVNRFAGMKRWIVVGSCIQAASFVPLVYAAYVGEMSFAAIVLVASLYLAAGLSVGPVWNAWVEEVVPVDGRVRFFSRRTRMQQISTFVALLCAAGILAFATQLNRALEAFAILFAIAGLSRTISASLVHRTEPAVEHSSVGPVRSTPSAPENSAAKPAAENPSTALPGIARRFLLYMVCMQIFIQLSGPFFVPYMLKELEFSYATYVCVIALAFIAKVASTGFWARVAEKHGSTRVLWLGGLGLVPLAALWIVSGSVWWIASIQIVSGVAWSAYELGMFLAMFDAVPKEIRTRMLSYYNFASSIAICVGAVAGASVLTFYGSGGQAYSVLFGTSSIGRLVCIGLLVGIVLPKAKLKFIATRVISVRPGAASIVAPITASVDEAQAQPGR